MPLKRAFLVDVVAAGLGYWDVQERLELLQDDLAAAGILLAGVEDSAGRADILVSTDEGVATDLVLDYLADLLDIAPDAIAVGPVRFDDAGPVLDPPQQSAPALPTEPRPPRYLTAEIPERAPLGCEIGLLVRIVLPPPGEHPSAELRPFDVPPEGRTVTVTVSASNALRLLSSSRQRLHVPADGDSDPVDFGFALEQPGVHSVRVLAFAGGTLVGELTVWISVEAGGQVSAARRRRAGIDDVAPVPKEVTLLVGRTDGDRYSFQLIGDALYPVEVTPSLSSSPTGWVDRLVTELRTLAVDVSRRESVDETTGRPTFTDPAAAHQEIEDLGRTLWNEMVPPAVQEQFWQHVVLDEGSSLTIMTERDTIPWELLYPHLESADFGFLADRRAVQRRVYGRAPASRLRLTSAAYVVPPGSPENAEGELEAVRRRLGRVRDDGVLDGVGPLRELLETPSRVPGVLHFACHNEFGRDTGSVLHLADGVFRPRNLARAVARRSLETASPLVFFNACRSAGEVPGLLDLMGWAKQFMAAGAGAFVGSLWAVRSDRALIFADAFYEAFVEGGCTLGEAARSARAAVRSGDGDPTWLAYTVYGNPAATVDRAAP